MTAAAATRTSLAEGTRHAAKAVVIGASAGGVDALLQVLTGLPKGYKLPVVVVLHLPEDRQSLLSEVFGHRMAIPVREATDKQPLDEGTLYFAPAGYHLLLESDCSFSLSCDAPEFFSRPSINVLLESAADALGDGTCGILLTGANEDGARGMARIGAAGGLTVVQDPQEAQCPDMPRAALALRPPDYVLPLKDIHTLIANLEPLPCLPPSS